MRDSCFLFLALALLTLDSRSSSSHPTTPAFSPAIGLNKFDLAMQYMGTASGCDGANLECQRVTKAMAKKAITDAGYAGFPYLRVAVMGYAPSVWGQRSDLDLWITDSHRYWKMMDEMMADLDRANLRLVPVFVWHNLQLPATTGETLSDLLDNPRSQSSRLLKKYVTAFAQRYRHRSTLLFYELTNEFNLDADLDLPTLFRENGRLNQLPLVKRFTTDELISFTVRLANDIRQADPDHLISSGFSMPRYNAEYFRRILPSPPTTDWRIRDTSKQFQKNLRDIHQCCEIISVHFYNGPHENTRFGITDRQSTELLTTVKQTADGLGKLVFVGEFGEIDPHHYSREINFPFLDRTLQKIVELKIPFSAPWAWEFYQFNTYTAYQPGGVANIEPGYTDHLISRLIAANQMLGLRPLRPSPAEGLHHPLQIVITWPFNNSRLADQQMVHVVASNNRGKMGSIHIRVGGVVVACLFSPPYQCLLDTRSWAPGEHHIEAIAVNSLGQTVSDKITVRR